MAVEWSIWCSRADKTFGHTQLEAFFRFDTSVAKASWPRYVRLIKCSNNKSIALTLALKTEAVLLRTGMKPSPEKTPGGQLSSPKTSNTASRACDTTHRLGSLEIQSLREVPITYTSGRDADTIDYMRRGSYRPNTINTTVICPMQKEKTKTWGSSWDLNLITKLL